MALVFRLFLVLLGASSALACGSGGAHGDNSSGAAGTGGADGPESSGGSSPVGSGGSSGGSGAASSGGSPDPDQKPNPVDVYPCYGESHVYEVNSDGETAATASKISQFYYDEAGHTLKLLNDDNADGAFDTGSYYAYDSDGTMTVYDYDNDGDTVIDSRAEYSYDAGGKLRSIDYFAPVGTLALYYTIEYDEQNRRTQIKQFRAADDFEVRIESYAWSSAWEYDYTMSSAGETNEVSHIVLNKYGDVAAKETWADEAKTTWVSKTTISYDELGRPVSEEVESEAATRVTGSSYGDNGLISEQSVRENDKLIELIKYVYFDTCAE